MIPLVLEGLLKYADQIWNLQPLLIEPCTPLPEELAAAEREALSNPDFDSLGLKRSVWGKHKQGKLPVKCFSFAEPHHGQRRVLARVVVFGPEKVSAYVWSIWARIFQWIGPASNGEPWRITWYTSHICRTFPETGVHISQEHVNGGYTTPCSTNGIFIYRVEEATRVLLHELLHAACLDEPDWTVAHREAMIETWAEIFLIALLSKGETKEAGRLWDLQSHWIVEVNRAAERFNGVHSEDQYAWRYLNGRELMYGKLGVTLPSPKTGKRKEKRKSLRFTHPALEVV